MGTRQPSPIRLPERSYSDRFAVRFPADRKPDTGHDADALQGQAAELLARQLVAGRVPSVRAIRA